MQVYAVIIKSHTFKKCPIKDNRTTHLFIVITLYNIVFCTMNIPSRKIFTRCYNNNKLYLGHKNMTLYVRLCASCTQNTHIAYIEMRIKLTR